jgi:hypothetical protein
MIPSLGALVPNKSLQRTFETSLRIAIRRLGPDDARLCAAAVEDLLSSQSEVAAGYAHLHDALSDSRCYVFVALLEAKLIAALIDNCRKDGVAHIWAGTSSENLAAQRTFQATGARRVSETYLEYIFDLEAGEVQSTRCAT